MTLVFIGGIVNRGAGLLLASGAPILIHSLLLGGALLVCLALAALGGDGLGYGHGGDMALGGGGGVALGMEGIGNIF